MLPCNPAIFPSLKISKFTGIPYMTSGIITAVVSSKK
jgi:hypothetical protein